MNSRAKAATASLVLVCATAGVAVAQSGPRHSVPVARDHGMVVALCDGKTTLSVPGKKEGDTLTRREAQAVSDALMDAWKRNNPHARWDQEERVAQNATPPQPGGNQTDTAQHGATGAGQRAGVPAGGAAPTAPVASQAPNAQSAGGMPAAATPAVQAQVYGGFTTRDEQIWMASTQAFVDQGNKIFHDATELGSTNSVSCDMCHPNAANTHPETYPKYQVQLGKVALLRDMINWCIENPVRGKPLADDDPKLKALEAYILAQRRGVALDYGKH